MRVVVVLGSGLGNWWVNVGDVNVRSRRCGRQYECEKKDERVQDDEIGPSRDPGAHVGGVGWNGKRMGRKPGVPPLTRQPLPPHTHPPRADQ